ncbi:MAG: helix-turn-helix domain-containing protein [Candidatus Hodarchaeales archaeon]
MNILIQTNTLNLEGLSPSALKVLTFLVSSNEPKSSAEIIRGVNASQRSVRYALSDLTKRGIVVRKPFLNDMRQSRYILKAEIIKSKIREIVEIKLV